VRGVAKQHGLAVDPCLAGNGGERAPDRAVGQQLVALKVILEECTYVGNGLLLRCVLKACALPRLLGGLHNPCRKWCVTVLERVRVNVPRAVFVLAEDEGEGREGLVCSKPAELGKAPVDARLKLLCCVVPHLAVEAVACDDKVRGLLEFSPDDLGLVVQLHAQLAGARVEDPQQRLAR
jgi:hypothetical protein